MVFLWYNTEKIRKGGAAGAGKAGEQLGDLTETLADRYRRN